MRFTQTCVALALLSAPAMASAQIKQPGAHQRYSVELEPHLVVQWSESCASDGFGPGFRATIPFLDNGPIPNFIAAVDTALVQVFIQRLVMRSAFHSHVGDAPSEPASQLFNATDKASTVPTLSTPLFLCIKTRC